jgi:Holliday junction resolvasome RuvABC endonuclease subunit
MKTLISIDASSKATGIAIFKITKDNEVKYKTHFLITVPEDLKKSTKATKNLMMRRRIDFMMVEIIKILERYNPDYILMEDIYAGKDIHTLKMFGRLQGAIEYYSLSKQTIKNPYPVTLIYIAPNSWRSKLKFPNLKREELKQCSIKYIEDKLSITVTDDEADAICIGYSFPFVVKDYC